MLLLKKRKFVFDNDVLDVISQNGKSIILMMMMMMKTKKH